MRCIEKCQDDLNQMVKERLKSTEKQAEDLLKELEQEIEVLTNRSSELKQLLHTKDHLHFLQTFRSLKDPPPTRDWTTVEVRPPSYVGTLRRSLDQLEESLNMEMKKVPDLKSALLKYASELTLDPKTAHRHLSLSEDNREVTQLGEAQRVGVYLDRPAGTLSFYRVSPGGGGSSDTLTHLHTFQATFTQEDLLPVFMFWGEGSSVSLCRL
ncbi:unnamed protein product [Boreogadus saida]